MVIRPSTQFGPRRLDSIRPRDIKSWLVKLKAEGLADSYVYAIHLRFAHILAEAVHDGVLARSPASRGTSPKGGPAAALHCQHSARVGSAQCHGGAVSRRPSPGGLRGISIS